MQNQELTRLNVEPRLGSNERESFQSWGQLDVPAPTTNQIPTLDTC